MHALGRLVILVTDYDTAIAFYQDKLGMEVFVDMAVGAQRYVHLRLPEQPSVGVWLLQAQTQAQRDRVGDQTGGQPVGVFYTSDTRRDHARFAAQGVSRASPSRTPSRCTRISSICTATNSYSCN